MAITISGENNVDKILASDGVIDQLSGFSIVGVITATSFTGDLTGDVTGNLTGNVTGNINNSTLLLQTGGTERVRIASNGKVGVGVNPTNYPGKFVVSGDALICDRDIHSRVANSVANSDRGFKQDIDGTEKLHLYADNSSNIILEGNGGNERLRITSGGNIGMGVVGHDPLTRLHVQDSNNGALKDVLTITNSFGSANTEVGMVFECGTDEVARISAKNEGSDIGPLIFSTASSTNANPTEKLRITSDGKVSIGGFNPSVAGLSISNSSTNRGFEFDTGSGFDSTSCIRAYDRPTTAYKSLGLTGSEIRFGINDVEKVRITSNGDVGIGYDSPTVKLHIREATSGYSGTYDNRYHCIIEDDAEAYYGVYVPNNGYGGIRFHRAGGGASATSAVGYIDCYMANEEMHYYCRGSGTSGKHIFSTAGSERLRIASNGNIGIGNRTTSPDEDLHVHTASGDCVLHVEAAADPKLRLRAHSGESIVQFADASSSNIGEINYVHSGDYLKFHVNGDERLRILSDGKVGINETAPDRQLHVKSGANSNDGAFRIESANSNIMDMGTDGTGHFLNCVNADPFRVKFAGTEKLRIDSSGNVMIGRTAGQKPLSVRKVDNSSGVHIVQTIGGNNHVSGYAVGLGFDPEGYEARTKVAIVAEGISAGYSRANLHFLLDNNSNAGEVDLNDKKMTITEGGQIGIGQDGSGNVNTRAVLEISAPFNDVSDNDGSAAYTMNNHDAILINYSGASYSSGTNVGSIAWTNGGRRRAAIMAEYQSTDGDIVALSFFTRGTDGAGDFFRSFIINRNGSASLHGALSDGSSDDRLKKDKVEITNALDKVNSLSSFTHKWNDIAVRAGLEEDKEEIGLSAQEVQKLYPCLVDVNNVMKDPENPDVDYQTVHYDKVVPLLVASIKELTAKNKALEARLDALESS